jgi:DNA repair exonuclease SbcCD ATPase subunit
VATDLESAGTQTLARFNELMPLFEEAERAFEDAEKKIEKAHQDLEKKWKEAEDTTEEFLKQVAEDRKDNEDETTNTRDALKELKQEVLDATKEADQKIEDTREEIEKFGEDTVKGMEPKVEAIMKMVDDVAKSLEQKANEIEKELNTACSEASEFFENDICGFLEEFQRNVEDRAGQLYDFVTTEAVPDLQTKHSDFDEKLKNYTQDLGDKMEEEGRNALNEAQTSLTGCLGEHMETIRNIMGLGDTISTVLSGLAGGVETAGKTVGTCKETVEMGVDVTNVGTKAIIGCIEEFMEFAEKFTFL